MDGVSDPGGMWEILAFEMLSHLTVRLIVHLPNQLPVHIQEVTKQTAVDKAAVKDMILVE